MASTESVLSPRAQTIAVIVGAVTLLLSVGLGSYAPLVWLLAVVTTVVVVTVIGRRRERDALVMQHADELNELMADGRSPEVIRDEAMAEATSNLEKCEVAVTAVRFDGMAPMFVNDLRGLVGDFKITDDAVDDALRARRIQLESRQILTHVVAKKNGNFIRTVSTVVGMFSQK